jgi:hypothetical protein
MKKVYAIVCSGMPLHNSQFYSTKELARQKLKELADERKYKMGVNNLKLTEDKLSYSFGWEESFVCFSIVEFDVDKI